jgi:hypothetical protein
MARAATDDAGFDNPPGCGKEIAVEARRADGNW